MFNASTFNSNAKGFRGGVFDGRYLHFIPYGGSSPLSGLTVRFDVKAPAWTLPGVPGYSGSFY
jgi:hypothetical protein